MKAGAMKGSVASVAALLLVEAASAPIAAQDYPIRPLRAITALVPGGLSDVFMRVAGEEFQKQLGQPIVVENRPGGSLNIGGRACAEAPPDGYTICILPVETLSYNKFLFKKLPFDPEKDFAPITNLFFVTQVLAVNAAMKVKTLDELAALSKAKPGTLSYVAPSVPLSLFMDKFKQSSGADMVKVPYRGGGDAVNGILSGATAIAAHADETVRARLAAQGFEVSGVTGAAFAQSIDQQFERWAKIVKATGFSATE
jgi:tripartite-type tricarboxylate transporter receptor subunit TctC